jgi:AraC family transcriptional regulator
MMQVSQLLPDRVSQASGSHILVHQQAVERVIRAMRDHPNEPFTLQGMAAIAYLSPNHFHRVFHRIIGIPPGEFLTALRLDAAKRLLLTTSMRVTDICYEVGYSSLGSFTTRFTELVGLAPSRLRQQMERFVMPSLDAFRPQNFVLCHFPLRGCFYGRVSCSDTFTGMIYVGLFPRPIPQGRPVRWMCLTKPGPYMFAYVPEGSYYALAVAFPKADDPQAYLLPGRGVLIGLSQGKLAGQQDIALHLPRLTDPPIVGIPPFL